MHSIKSFYWGAALTPYESLCLRSFVDHGHNVELYTYNLNLQVPRGVALVDARTILPESDYFDSPSLTGADCASAFSNLFRYTLLYRRGGWWVDTDVVCLTSDIPNFDLFIAYQAPDSVNSAVIFAPPEHPLLGRCAEVATARKGPVAWGSTGPNLMTEMVKSLGLLNSVQPASVCYPIPPPEALDVLRPEKSESVASRVRSSLLVHLWNQILLLESVDKHALPPNGSFLRRLADLHPVDGWRSELSKDFVEAKVELSATRKRIGETEAKLAEAQNIAVAANAELTRVKEELHCTQASLKRARKELAAIRTSSSWRMTRPLRSISNLLFRR